MDTIYLIDDNADFLYLADKAFKKRRPGCKVCCFGSAQQLWQYWSSQHQTHGSAQLPRLIIADLRMPGINGLQLLELLKQHVWEITPVIRTIPVIMLSGSGYRSEIQACYQAGANSFLVKPILFDALENMLDITASYWLDYNLVPHALPDLPDSPR